MTGSWSHYFCISLTGCWKWCRLPWAACWDLQRSHSQTQWLPREEGPWHYVLCGSILLRAEQELEQGNHKVIVRFTLLFDWLNPLKDLDVLLDKTVFDSGFKALDSGSQVLGLSLYKWNLDSGFQSLVAFRNPEPRIPDSTSKFFFQFQNSDSLTWCDTCRSRASDGGEVEGFVTCSTAQPTCNSVGKQVLHILKLFPSTLVVSWQFHR